MSDIADAWLYGHSLAELTRVTSRAFAASRRMTCCRWARTYFDPARRVEGIVRGTTVRR